MKNEHCCQSPKRRQIRVKTLTSEWNQNYQHFLTHPSRLSWCFRFVNKCFGSEEVCQRRIPPWPTFACGGATCLQTRTKNNNTCREPWVLHFYQVSLKYIKWFWRRCQICMKIPPCYIMLSFLIGFNDIVCPYYVPNY